MSTGYGWEGYSYAEKTRLFSGRVAYRCMCFCCDWQQALVDLETMRKQEQDQRRSAVIKDKVCIIIILPLCYV